MKSHSREIKGYPGYPSRNRLREARLLPRGYLKIRSLGSISERRYFPSAYFRPSPSTSRAIETIRRETDWSKKKKTGRKRNL